MKIHYDCARVASPAHRTLLTSGDISSTHSCKELNRLQDCNVAGRIVSMKRSSGHIGNKLTNFGLRNTSTNCTTACPTSFASKLHRYLEVSKRRKCPAS